MLRNGSFTEGWTDMPPALGHLINQQPKGWTLRWIEPGQPLFDSSDRAGGVPECVHKLAHQLPPNEQLGAPDALILAGDATYKIFHFGAAFGAELKQTVVGLQPGSAARLIAPILVVLHGETDPFAAESGVWVNDEGGWVNGDAMGDRRWFRHVVEFTVPASGAVDVTIRVKSKWPRPKDFFIDGIELRAEPVAPITEPGDGGSTGTETGTPAAAVQVTVPTGMRVIRAEGNANDTIVVVAPKGMRIRVQRPDPG